MADAFVPGLDAIGVGAFPPPVEERVLADNPDFSAHFAVGVVDLIASVGKPRFGPDLVENHSLIGTM